MALRRSQVNEAQTSHSIDPNPIAVIDEDARVPVAAHKEINNSGRYTHI